MISGNDMPIKIFELVQVLFVYVCIIGKILSDSLCLSFPVFANKKFILKFLLPGIDNYGRSLGLLSSLSLPLPPP